MTTEEKTGFVNLLVFVVRIRKETKPADDCDDEMKRTSARRTRWKFDLFRERRLIILAGINSYTRWARV